MNVLKRYSLRKLSLLLILFVAGIAPFLTVNHGAGQTIPAGPVYLPIVLRPAEPTATNTPVPTATTVPATNTPVPTNTALPVATNTPLPTATTALLYICSSDAYNCSDFDSQAEAQEVFNYCAVRGFGDIHKLDQNNDGEACESLP
jgi:hypothetical protein